MPSPTTTVKRGVWPTYFYWFLWIGVAFFTVYPLCNWVTARRDTVLQLYSEAELQIPFVPGFVWLYLSLYLLFLLPPFFFTPARMNWLGKRLVGATLFCGLVFLVFPAELGFERQLPLDSVYEPIFVRIFAVDLPHNMVPSLHVTFSAMFLFALADDARSVLARAVFRTWLVLICLSTVLVHQHHVLDVVTGLLVAAGFYYLSDRGERHG